MILNFDEYLKVLSNQELNEEIDFNDEIISIEEVEPTEMLDISLNGNNVFYGNDILIHNCAINKIDGVDNSAVSDSYGTNATADLMVFILQNEVMKEKSEVLVKFTKNRYTGITDSFMLNIDYQKMRFSDVIDETDFKTFEEKQSAEQFAKQEIRQVQKQDQQIAKNEEKMTTDDILSMIGI